MMDSTSTFQIEVEDTTGICPAGERYADKQLREGKIPVLSCEGPCIRGEIARQAAHLVGKQPPFARACQGEAMSVPHSGMARWIHEADRVLVLDGCFLRCQARQMRRMLRSGQLVEIDALKIYHKYSDLFEIDSVPEEERKAVARQVAEQVLAQVTKTDGTVGASGQPGGGNGVRAI